MYIYEKNYKPLHRKDKASINTDVINSFLLLHGVPEVRHVVPAVRGDDGVPVVGVGRVEDLHQSTCYALLQ
jgi:hypothetical protein